MIATAKIRALLFTSCFIASAVGTAGGDPLDPDCRERLSKQAKMIYDKSLENKANDGILAEFVKEVARDLITDNALGREQATDPTLAALACLEARRVE